MVLEKDDGSAYGLAVAAAKAGGGLTVTEPPPPPAVTPWVLEPGRLPVGLAVGGGVIHMRLCIFHWWFSMQKKQGEGGRGGGDFILHALG